MHHLADEKIDHSPSGTIIFFKKSRKDEAEKRGKVLGPAAEPCLDF